MNPSGLVVGKQSRRVVRLRRLRRTANARSYVPKNVRHPVRIESEGFFLRC